MKPEDIREHLMVHARGTGSMGGAQGVHVGTVDRVDGNYVKLTRNDAPDGRHHWIPIGWVERIDERAVYLSKTADEFRQGAMTSNPSEASLESGASGVLGAGSAASGHIAGGTGSAYGNLTGGTTTNATENVQSAGAGSDSGVFGRLPTEYGGTLSGRDPLVEDTAFGSTGTGSGLGGAGSLSSSGGSMLSDAEIAQAGSASPADHGEGTRRANQTTDSYTSVGVGNTTSDTRLMSGAGAASGDFMDRNANTGASGNVSSDTDEPQHVGQGTRGVSDRGQDVAGNISAGALESGDNSNLQGTVQGMEAYDNSYSGGSAAMPSAGGSAATPESTMNTNLDPALAGSDFDREAMGQAVDQRSDDLDEDEGRRG